MSDALHLLQHLSPAADDGLQAKDGNLAERRGMPSRPADELPTQHTSACLRMSYCAAHTTWVSTPADVLTYQQDDIDETRINSAGALLG